VTERNGRRPGARTWLALTLALAIAGVVAIGVAVTGQQSPPTPAAARATETPPSTSPAAPPPPPSTVEEEAADAGTPSPSVSPSAAPAAVAAPVSLAIPAIGVTSDLLRLGLNGDGSVQVPPLAADDEAGWYERGPAPGAVGPAVVLGHVDSAAHGPGVFFELGGLAPGDEIAVTRADGTVAVFAVDRVERHPKDDFPTIDVYGNTEGAQLRLITCGGVFDAGARSYEDNVIAFASLVRTESA